MNVLHYDDPLPSVPQPSIFLAGPTARGLHTPWRREALARLEAGGWDGAVLVPEPCDASNADAVDRIFGALGPSPVPHMRAVSYHILRWETAGIEGATCVLFWMPFVVRAEGDPTSLPGFTTRAEVGRELARAPDRIVLGMPEHAVSSAHIRFHAHQAGVVVHDTLAAAVDAAVRRANRHRR